MRDPFSHVQGLVNHSEDDVTAIMGGLYGLIDGNQSSVFILT
jgi:hypothetical protein